MENTKELNFEDLDKIVGGTRLEACKYLDHLFEKYGTRSTQKFKTLWTKEEKEYLSKAYNRKAGEEAPGPYPNQS